MGKGEPLQIFGKLRKRARQLLTLGLNLSDHWRCSAAIQRSRAAGVVPDNPMIPFKYLGDYLSLSMSTTARRQALVGHYERLASMAGIAGDHVSWCDSILLWEIEGGAYSPLSIFLEPAQLAPMEGELQLRFASGRRNMFTLTFLFAPGDLFASPYQTILFIGGVQGGMDCRVEMRRAAKENGEIAPAAMLLLTIRALAKVLDIGQIFAVAEEDQIAASYATEKMKLDYRDFWSQAGGVRQGHFYLLDNESIAKPLREIPTTHRSRTKRKREHKARIREAIEARLRLLLTDAPTSTAADSAPSAQLDLLNTAKAAP
jgi:uncharacterized protein VirK/YbjX